MCLHCCDIAWLTTDGTPVSRSGLHVWRVSSAHYNNRHAKKPESAKHVLKSVFALLLRDQVRLFGADLNQASRHVESVLEDLCSDTGVSYQIFKASSPEVVAVVFNYPGLPYLTGEQRSAIESVPTEAFGIRATDADSHLPLILCIKKLSLIHI